MQEKTISQVQAELRAQIYDGTQCPCCLQHVQIYKRPLTASMIQAMVLLYHAPANADGFVHVEQYLKSVKCSSAIRGDVSKLRFWNFIQPKDTGEDTKIKRGNGYYKLLQAGKDFIFARIQVHSHAKIYNNCFLGYDGKLVTVHSVVKKKFDLQKLLEGTL